MKFARGQDPPCPWNESICDYAAQLGHLEVLKWARDQDPPCPWDWRTCREAARNGHLEVVRWVMLQEDRPSVLDLPDYVVELLKAEGFFDGEG